MKRLERGSRRWWLEFLAVVAIALSITFGLAGLVAQTLPPLYGMPIMAVGGGAIGWVSVWVSGLDGWRLVDESDAGGLEGGSA